MFIVCFTLWCIELFAPQKGQNFVFKLKIRTCSIVVVLLRWISGSYSTAVAAVGSLAYRVPLRVDQIGWSYFQRIFPGWDLTNSSRRIRAVKIEKKCTTIKLLILSKLSFWRKSPLSKEIYFEHFYIFVSSKQDSDQSN